MAKYNVKLIPSGMTEFMTSDEVISILEEQAQGLLGRLGDGFAFENAYKGRKRANVSIETVTNRAYYGNLYHNTILKAIGGGK